MKVAYLSPLDSTGYGQSAISHALALDSIGIDVVCRHVKMSDAKIHNNLRIKELEQKDLENVDAVIQHNLPSEFAYRGGIKNIGMFCYETNNFKNSGWANNLLLMDKVIVPCHFQKDSTIRTCKKLESKISVLPHPVDTDKFDKEYDSMDFETTRKTVKFYSISEINRRKNIVSLILSYYSTFSSYDNVLLVLKLSAPGVSGDGVFAQVKKISDDLRKSLKRFKNEEMYPKIALVPGFLTESNMSSLHKSCDVFVSASRGESICLPYLDALGFGNPAIGPRHSSFLDYGEVDLLVDSQETIVFGSEESPDGLYTGEETWSMPSALDLSNKMREVYDNIEFYKSEDLTETRKQTIKDKLSFSVVGNKLKDIIDAD